MQYLRPSVPAHNKILILSRARAEAVLFFYIFCFGRYQINTCRFDAAVTHNVCQAYYISAQTVKTPCKKMSQVVGKNFPAQNTCMTAEIFHICPYLLAAQWAAVFAQKNLSCFYAEFSHVYPELFAKFVRYQNRPVFSFH